MSKTHRSFGRVIRVCLMLFIALGITAPAMAQQAATPISDGLGSSAIPMSSFDIHFQVCGNDSRQGTFDFSTSGTLSGADTSSLCRSFSDAFPGESATITLTNDTYGPYSATFDANTEVNLTNAVVPGAYTVTVSSTNGVTTTMAGTLDVSSSSNFLYVTYFIAGETSGGHTDPGTDGVLSGVLLNCIDPARDGEVDYFINNLFATDADSCIQGQGAFSQSFTVNGPEGPVAISIMSDGTFNTSGLTYGIYDFTVDGYASSPFMFMIGTETGTTIDMRIVVYHAGMPAAIEVTKSLCTGGDRDAGDVDYLVQHSESFTVADTCQLSLTNDPFELTLSNGDDYSETITILANGSSSFFPPAPAGTYTIQETGKPESRSFDIVDGEFVTIQVINYLGPATNPTPPNDSGLVLGIQGFYAYCTSAERDGEVDFRFLEFVIMESTGDCTDQPTHETAFQIERYDDPSGTAAYTWNVTGVDGRFDIPQTDPNMLPGYYRIGYLSDALAAPVWSDFIALPTSTATFLVAQIKIYSAPNAIGSVLVNKWYCHDEARDGETDFVVESQFSAASTANCRPANFLDGEIDFTLVNTGTSASISQSLAAGDWSVTFSNLPAGTYTLTESSTSHNATSPEFDIDDAPTGYAINVLNYTSAEITTFPSDVVYFQLAAFNCFDPARAGEFDYIWLTYGSFVPVSLGDCTPASPGEFSFELTDDLSGSDVSAADTFPLVLAPGTNNWYMIDNGGSGTVPTGTYIIRETALNLASDPILMSYGENEARFYLYQAAPTPTATATATNTPTATATSTATSTPTATSTATATATATGTLPPTNTPTSTVDPGMPPTRTPTPTPETGGGSTGGDTGSGDGGGVNTLPSTGQGQGSGSGWNLALLLVLATTFLMAAAALARNSRQR